MANQLVSEVFDSFAKNAGIDRESERWKLFLSDPKLIDLNIDSEFIQKIEGSFLTLDSAKNNPELQKHFVAKALSSVDVAAARALKAMGVSEEIMKAFNAEENTPKKIETVLGKLKEELSKPHDDPDAEKIRQRNEELSQKVNELTEQVNGFPTEIEKVRTELMGQHESELIGYELTNKLSGYTFNPSIPREDINDMVQTKISKLPYVIRKEGGELKVYQKESPELLAQKNNKTVTVSDLLDDVVSPYIKKGGDPPPEGGKTEPPKPQTRGYNQTLQEKMEGAAGAGIKPAMSKD